MSDALAVLREPKRALELAESTLVGGAVGAGLCSLAAWGFGALGWISASLASLRGPFFSVTLAAVVLSTPLSMERVLRRRLRLPVLKVSVLILYLIVGVAEGGDALGLLPGNRWLGRSLYILWLIPAALLAEGVRVAWRGRSRLAASGLIAGGVGSGALFLSSALGVLLGEQSMRADPLFFGGMALMLYGVTVWVRIRRAREHDSPGNATGEQPIQRLVARAKEQAGAG